jgi:hypothetical protein
MEKLLALSFENTLLNDGLVTAPLVWTAAADYVSGPYGFAADFERTADSGCIKMSKAGKALSGMSELTLSFYFHADSTAETARPVWLHTAYGVQIKGDNLSLALWTDASPTTPKWIDAKVPAILDGGWHNFTATYDSQTGTARLYLDKAVVAESTGIVGKVNLAASTRALTIGSELSGGKKFDGQIDNLTILDGIEPPMTIHVATAAALASALAAATGGETIVLAPGDYGDLAVYGKHFSDYVTIRAQERAEAVLSKVDVQNASYIRFDGLTIERPLPVGSPTYDRAFHVKGLVENLEILNCEFKSSVDSNYQNDGYGLSIDKSSHILVQGNTFHDLTIAALFGTSSNLIVRDNVVYSLGADGFNFAQVQNVLIENNYMHGFYPVAGTHPDFIQFWTRGTTIPTENVTIRGNVLMQSGVTDGTQAIFMKDEVGTLPYKNFLIEDNIIYNSSLHGISLNGGIDYIIRNNTVATVPAATSPSSIAIFAHALTDNILVENNIASAVSTSVPAATTLNNNVVVQWQDPKGANYYGDNFIDGFGGDSAQDLLPLPGSAIDQAGSGATARILELGTPKAYIADETYPGTIRSLEVTLTADEYQVGALAGGPLAYTWDFGDGAQAEGQTVTHTFARGGTYDVTLTVSGGTESYTVDRAIPVWNPLKLSLGFEQTLANTGELGGTTAWTKTADFVTGADGYAANFEKGDGNFVKVSNASRELSGMEELTLAFDFRADGVSSSRPLWLHTGYGMVFGADNSISFLVGTADGFKNAVAVKAPQAFDGGWHELLATYDAKDGISTLYLDGDVIGEQGGRSGRIVPVVNRDLTIGSDSWGAEFDGQIDNVRILTGILTPEQADWW